MSDTRWWAPPTNHTTPRKRERPAEAEALGVKLAFGYGRVGGKSSPGFLAFFAFFSLHTGSQGSAIAGDAATAIATATSAVVRPTRRVLLIGPPSA
jgi:hypothetical protein